MLKEFEELREDEIDLMLSVPILVSVLIAGADGNLSLIHISEPTRRS